MKSPTIKSVFNAQQIPIILAVTAGLVVAIVLILKLGPAADNSQADKTDTSQAATEPAPTPSVTDPGNQQTAPTAATTITIGANGFTPAAITVAKGTTLTWTNSDTAAHAVDTAAGKTGPHSPQLAPKSSFSYSFQAAGTYIYTDPTNPSHTGTITVKEVD